MTKSRMEGIPRLQETVKKGVEIHYPIRHSVHTQITERERHENPPQDGEDAQHLSDSVPHKVSPASAHQRNVNGDRVIRAFHL